MRKPYDLQALMHEMQQSARQGLVSIEDMRRMTDLVLDRLGCTTGGRGVRQAVRGLAAVAAGHR
ncbi:hypothetical protein [Streptomyces clavuligerus]|uniref:hypothetical protein n=1 Tax=Streptomyces clavuligerus TaxID=1901 RepID=UPI001F07C8B7|nr:hypothetical protein [Streptomyces clavuligerus]